MKTIALNVLIVIVALVSVGVGSYYAGMCVTLLFRHFYDIDSMTTWQRILSASFLMVNALILSGAWAYLWSRILKVSFNRLNGSK
jgi:hypothetical protein